MLKVTATCNILNHTPIDSISHLASIVVYRNVCLTEQCQQKGFHRRQWIWLHLVAYMARNNSAMTIQNHRMTVHNMPLAKTVNVGNTPINMICCKCTVTHIHSSQFQALRSFITSLHSTWHTIRNLPAAQAKDFQVMGHCGKDMTWTKVLMAGLKCSPLRSSQDKGGHLQVHWECLQDCRGIIQSISQHVSARLLHRNLLLEHLGGTP